MRDHASERAMERLGVDLDAREACRIARDIRAGRTPADSDGGGGRWWYRAEIQGCEAWCLYDRVLDKIITVLGEPPQAHHSPVRFFALADECGIAHAEARRIATPVYKFLRHAHKTQTLTYWQAQRLRPLFEAARTAPKEEIVSDLVKIATPMAQAMTVKQVAEALGVSDDSVLRVVKDRFPELVQNGRPTYLGEAHVTAIKLELEGHHNLRSTAELQNVHTELEMIEKARDVMAWMTAEADRLRAELANKTEALAIAAPKVESFDRFIDATGTVCMQDAGKQLGHGPNKFIDAMAARGLIFRRNGTWIARQEYVDRGWFVVRSVPRLDGGLSEQTRITPKGLDALAKIFPRVGAPV